MFGSQRKTTLIVCISFLAVTIAVAALAETIGQKTLRLKRDGNKQDGATYTRAKYTREGKTTPRPRTTTIDPADPLNLVPADSLVCVRINNFGNTLSRLDQYLVGVSPLPLSMVAAPWIGGVIGNPMLSGINFDGNIVLFAKLSAGSPEPAIGILIPVTKYEEFTGGNPNCSEPDADGISAIRPPKSMLGNLISVKAPGGKYAILAQPSSKSTLLEIAGSTGKSLASRLRVSEQKLATQSPLWIFGNVEAALNIFMSMIDGALQDVQALANQTVIKSGGKVDDAEQAQKMIMLKDSITQLKSLSLTLTPMQDKLIFSLNLNARQGSDFAKAMTADASAESGFKLAGYLKDAAAINVAAKINKPLLTKVMNLIKELVPVNSDPMIAKIFDTNIKSIEGLGSEMAFSLSPGSGNFPLSFKQIVTVSDKNKIEDIVKMQFAIFEGAPQDAKSPKMESQAYAEGLIYSISMPLPEEAAAVGIDMPKVHVAVVNDKAVSSMGSIEDMKSLVDQSLAGPGSASGDIATALQLVENSADMDFVASINLLRMMGIASKTMMTAPVPQAQMVVGMLSGLKTDSNSCMAIAGKIDNGTANIQYVLPKDHLMEVIGAVMQVQQKMMQMKMEEIQKIQSE